MKWKEGRRRGAVVDQRGTAAGRAAKLAERVKPTKRRKSTPTAQGGGSTYERAVKLADRAIRRRMPKKK